MPTGAGAPAEAAAARRDAAGAALPDIGSLTRDDLGAAAGFIKKGAWNKADVLLVVARQGRWVVKDYGRKGWLVKAAGRMQLAREERAYRRLEGLRGIPRLGRRIDRDAIAVEFVEGLRLPKFNNLWPLPALASRLEAMLGELHGRGVIHNDIRSRDNILVTPARSLFLIDFSSALIFRPGSAAYRLLMPAFRRAEWRAFLKWKSTIDPEGMTEREWAIHRRFGRLRRLWPFNPKRDLEVKRRRAARRGAR